MTYKEQHAALIVYLKTKVASGDWHGVSDAANDLRVLETAGMAYGWDAKVSSSHP